jgi:hypothetical protein
MRLMFRQRRFCASYSNSLKLIRMAWFRAGGEGAVAAGADAHAVHGLRPAGAFPPRVGDATCWHPRLTMACQSAAGIVSRNVRICDSS